MSLSQSSAIMLCIILLPVYMSGAVLIIIHSWHHQLYKSLTVGYRKIVAQNII